jgi:hypothetical protein
MSKFRSHWLAVFGGVTLLALSMSSAFAGKPDGPNVGSQVSAFVHSLDGDVEETDTDTADETETEDDTENTDETEVEESEFSNHGECVKAVAQDKDTVGGDNENHGGAVSEAARVTCQDDAAAGESDGDTEDDGDTETESDEDAGSEAAADKAEFGKSHRAGHGKHSSDD